MLTWTQDTLGSADQYEGTKFEVSKTFKQCKFYIFVLVMILFLVYFSVVEVSELFSLFRMICLRFSRLYFNR